MAEKNFFDKVKIVAGKTNRVVQPVTKKATDSAGSLAASAGRKYEESGVKERIDSAANTVKQQYEDSGLKDRAESVSNTVSGQFDIVSGQAMFQAVQDHLAKQEQYNDVLANKLFEALERIKQLEETLGLKSEH